MLTCYLARAYPASGLVPEDAEGQARAVSWMSFAAATQHPARRRGNDHARAVYALADRRLGGREWALGRYSVADNHLFRLYRRFRNSLDPAPGEFPSLAAHHDRTMQRPAVRQTIAIEQAIGYEPPG